MDDVTETDTKPPTSDEMAAVITTAIVAYCEQQYDLVTGLFAQPTTRNRYMSLVRSMTVFPRGLRQVCISVKGPDARLWGDLVTSAVVGSLDGVTGKLTQFDTHTGNVIFTW